MLFYDKTAVLHIYKYLQSYSNKSYLYLVRQEYTAVLQIDVGVVV